MPESARLKYSIMNAKFVSSPTQELTAFRGSAFPTEAGCELHSNRFCSRSPWGEVPGVPRTRRAPPNRCRVPNRCHGIVPALPQRPQSSPLTGPQTDRCPDRCQRNVPQQRAAACRRVPKAHHPTAKKAILAIKSIPILSSRTKTQDRCLPNICGRGEPPTRQGALHPSAAPPHRWAVEAAEPRRHRSASPGIPHPPVPTAQLFPGRGPAHFLLRGRSLRPWWMEPCGPQEVRMLRLAQLWSFLSFLWAENGSILDPNGGPKPAATNSGDNGSGLDPNG